MHHRIAELRKNGNGTADDKYTEYKHGDAADTEQKIRYPEAERKNPDQNIELLGYSVAQSVPYLEHAQGSHDAKKDRNNYAVNIISSQDDRNINQSDDKSD